MVDTLRDTVMHSRHELLGPRELPNKLKTTRFREWWFGLTIQERRDVADQTPVSYQYIKTHVVIHPPRKLPRMTTMIALVKASNGELSMGDMLAHCDIKGGELL